MEIKLQDIQAHRKTLNLPDLRDDFFLQNCKTKLWKYRARTGAVKTLPCPNLFSISTILSVTVTFLTESQVHPSSICYAAVCFCPKPYKICLVLDEIPYFTYSSQFTPNFLATSWCIFPLFPTSFEREILQCPGRRHGALLLESGRVITEGSSSGSWGDFHGEKEVDLLIIIGLL